MQIVINKITLDLKKSGTQATINVKKGDIQSRAVLITLRCDGINYRVNDGVTAIFRAKKPDNTVIYNNATVQDGKVYFLLTSNYCAVKGKYTGEIQLLKEGRVLYAPKFTIIVEDNIYDDSEIESTNEYTQLTEAIEDAQEALETAQALQLIKYVTNLDDPGDKKYLYVLENTKPYFTMTNFPTTTKCAVIFESTNSDYPFLALTGMIIEETTGTDIGVMKFKEWCDDPSATGNYTSLFGYSAAENKWVDLYDFDYYGSHALSEGDEIIVSTGAVGTHSPVISNYTIKSHSLYEIGYTGIVYIYDNSVNHDAIYYYISQSSTQTLGAEDNVIDIENIPEILAEPIGFPYVYDEVTNQYVVLEDANIPNILTRLTAAETSITNINSELDFNVLITLGTTPSINHTFNEIKEAITNYGSFPIRLFYTENNVPKYADGYIYIYNQLLRILFKFDISTKDKLHTITVTLNIGNQLTVTDEYTEVQPKLTAGSNVTIENNVISATGGGSGGGIDPIIFDKTSSPISSTCTFSELKTLYDTYGGALPIYIYANPFTSGTGNRYYPLSELYYDVTNNWFKLYFDKTADQTYNKYVEVLTFKSDNSIVNTFLHALSQPWLTEDNAGDGISITSGGESLKISVDYPNGDSIEY